MPRQQRYRMPGVAQHVIQRGNNRQVTFYDEADYRRYLECLEEAADKRGCQVHAYVLMTNHVHLLMTPSEKDSIPKVMQSVGRKYVQYINHCYKRTGTLWEGRYKASPVQDEDYLLSCYRYIELNPVRANMVSSPSGYKWSSYHYNAWGKDDTLVKPHQVYEALSHDRETRQISYRELFRHRMDNALLHEIRQSIEQCRVIGNGRFRCEIEKALNIKARPGQRGRPRKVET